jgi:hypothetical protein
MIMNDESTALVVMSLLLIGVFAGMVIGMGAGAPAAASAGDGGVALAGVKQGAHSNFTISVINNQPAKTVPSSSLLQDIADLVLMCVLVGVGAIFLLLLGLVLNQ